MHMKIMEMFKSFVCRSRTLKKTLIFSIFWMRRKLTVFVNNVLHTQTLHKRNVDNAPIFNTKSPSYQKAIEKESEYWGNFEEKSLRYGIPWWVDLRRATKIERPCNSVWFDDPQVETILRGKEKRYLIAKASKNKDQALDLGCGAGWLSLELARNGMFVDGIEVSEKRLDIAKRFLKENPFIDNFGGVNYRIGDLNQIELESEVYEVVVAWDTLHHIFNLDPLMRQAKKSLRAGGSLFVYDHIGQETSLFRKVLSKTERFIKKMLLLDNGLQNKNLDKVEMIEKPPFEDVMQKEMIDIIKKYFDIKVFRTRLSPFVIFIASKVKSYRLLSLIARIDDLLCDLHLANGEYVFIHAQKEPKKARNR